MDTVWSRLVRAKIKLGLLFGWRSRRSGFGWSSRNFLATFATRATSVLAAAIAAVATLAEQAVALLTTAALVTAMAAAEQLLVSTAAIAAAALVTAMAAAEQLLVTTAAIAAAITTAAAVATEHASAGLLFTADQGDASNREENRDTTKNNTIHPRSSKKTYRYRKRKRFVARVVFRGSFTACGETKPAGATLLALRVLTVTGGFGGCESLTVA